MLGLVSDCIDSWSDVAVALTAFMQTSHVSVMVRDDADVDNGTDLFSTDVLDAVGFNTGKAGSERVLSGSIKLKLETENMPSVSGKVAGTDVEN